MQNVYHPPTDSDRSDTCHSDRRTHEAEKGPLAVKPTAKKRQRDRIPAEVAELLAD
jgi:hypothetical protein